MEMGFVWVSPRLQSGLCFKIDGIVWKFIFMSIFSSESAVL